MAWRSSRERACEVRPQQNGGAPGPWMQFTEAITAAESCNREPPLEQLQKALALGTNASRPTAEAVRDLARLAALILRLDPATAEEHKEIVAAFCKLVADVSTRIPLAGPAAAVTDITSALLLGLPGPSESSSEVISCSHSLQAISHIIHENGPSLTPATTALILDRLLPLCKGPVVPFPLHSKPLADSTPPRNRARGRSWSSVGSQPLLEDPTEVQRLTLVAVSNLFSKAEAQITKAQSSQALEVLSKRLEQAVLPGATGRLSEDLSSSRLYAALLHCLQLVLAHGSTSLESQVSTLVPSLRPFFTYGLSKRPGSTSTTPKGGQSWRRTSFQDSQTVSDSEIANKLETLDVSGSAERKRNEGAGPGPGSTSQKAAYVPPHLRNSQQALLPTPVLVNRGTPSKQVALPVSSSESEQSDSDGSLGNSDRLKASKVRIEALNCVQTIAKREPKALHSQWSALLPSHGALLSKPQTPNLLSPLLFDPLPKVRLAAASALAAMLEGPAKAFLQAAEWKDNARPGPFLSLSATLGLTVKQLHAALLQSIGTELNANVAAAAFRALSLLISASPYHRLPEELLPDTVKQMARKTRALLANHVAAESAGVGAAAVACLSAAFGTSSPVESVAQLLTSEPSDPNLLLDLVRYCQTPTPPLIAVEAFAALREALRNYGARLVALWPALSALLAATFTSATDDRLVLGGVRAMDEFLRSISGNASRDDEDTQQASKNVKTESHLEGQATATWKEVLSGHVPWLLVHSASMVRSAALTCLAGLSQAVFDTLGGQEKDFVVASTVQASEDSIPAVRSAACRAAGILIAFSSLPDRDKLTQAILRGVRDSVVSVRILGAWALANLCEALQGNAESKDAAKLPLETLKPLAEAALEAARDGDKVRASAVRALGNLAAVADVAQHKADTWIDQMVAALMTCTTTGNVKVQWNVCHALALLFQNKSIDLASAPWASSVYSVLLLLLRTSTNFKIRIQAAAALAVPQTRQDYGVSFPDVVRCFAASLEGMDSDQGERPTDFKYRSNLQEQLSATLLHVLACAEPSDFSALRDPLIKRGTFLHDFINVAWASTTSSNEGESESQTAAAQEADSSWQSQKPPRHPATNFDEQPLPLPKKNSVAHGSLAVGSKPSLYDVAAVQRAAGRLLLIYAENKQDEAAASYASLSRSSKELHEGS